MGEFDYGKAPKTPRIADDKEQKGISTQNLEYRPELILDNKAKYEGQWATGTNIRYGKGKLIWIDGSIYEGWWKDNVASGKGRLLHSQGDIYQGEWANDQAHGEGSYLRADGSTYEGQWINNEQNGKGIETWKDNARFEGDYVRGMKHGRGFF